MERQGHDPIGQSYLPGYFCPAALFDSTETTRDKERVGQRQHREIIVPGIVTSGGHWSNIGVRQTYKTITRTRDLLAATAVQTGD